MNWDKAKEQIIENIVVDLDVNTKNSTNRFIKEAVNDGYKVLIGKRATMIVSFEMLEKCYLSISKGKNYNYKYFKENFLTKYNQHGCYVHVIGQIFCKANIAIQIDNHNYILKTYES